MKISELRDLLAEARHAIHALNLRDEGEFAETIVKMGNALEYLLQFVEWKPIENAKRDGSTYSVLRCKHPKHTCVGTFWPDRWKPIHSDASIHPIAFVPLPPPPEEEQKPTMPEGL